MPNNYFVEVRRINKLRLKDFIAEHPDMTKKKILALFSLQTGMRIATLERYYEELVDAEQIIIE